MPADLDLDLDRLPYETRRAIENGTDPVLVEQLTPGLFMRPEPDHDAVVVLTAEGHEVGTIPLGRLRDFDRDRLRPYAAKALEGWPTAQADQLLAAINNGGAEVLCPPDDDFVYVNVEGVRFMAVHRSNLVDGWPPQA